MNNREVIFLFIRILCTCMMMLSTATLIQFSAHAVDPKTEETNSKREKASPKTEKVTPVIEDLKSLAQLDVKMCKCISDNGTERVYECRTYIPDFSFLSSNTFPVIAVAKIVLIFDSKTGKLLQICEDGEMQPHPYNTPEDAMKALEDSKSEGFLDISMYVKKVS